MMKYKTFEELTNSHDMILCNELLYKNCDIVNGEDDYFNEDTEIMQVYIISKDFAEYLIRHTNLIIFHYDELDLYGICLTWYGTSWSYIEVAYYE